MPRNGEGVYIRTNGNYQGAQVWQQQADDDPLITPDQHDDHDEDIALALSASVASDGQTPMTGSLRMGGNKITGLGPATAAGDAVRFDQLTTANTTHAPAGAGQTVGLDQYLADQSGALDDAGSANVYAVTLGQDALDSYFNGLRFTFQANFACQDNPQLNANGIGEVPLAGNDGQPLKEGEIVSGQLLDVVFRGTGFFLMSPKTPLVERLPPGMFIGWSAPFDPDTPIFKGYVCDGRTFGKVGSGATIENDDAESLYGRLWSQYDQKWIEVVGGRGTGALDDWNAGKPMHLPDLRARSLVGSGQSPDSVEGDPDFGPGADRVLGEKGGTELHTQLGTEVGQHSHPRGRYSLANAYGGGSGGARFSEAGGDQNAAPDAMDWMPPYFASPWAITY